MAVTTKLRDFVIGDPSENHEVSDAHIVTNTERPKTDETGEEYPASHTNVKGDGIDNAQRGVQNIQATTMAWNKTSLATLLILYVLRRSLLHE